MENKNFRPNENFVYYLYFIKERMNIFWRRHNGLPSPYTNDEILRDKKFTNVYRCLDRSSQFLISDVIYNGVEYSKKSMFWRILIYKHFNLPDTWKWLIEDLGDIDESTKLEDISKSVLRYEKRYEKPPYSNAYMLTAAFLSGKNGKYVHLKGNGWKKHQYYFHIFEKEIDVDKFLECKSFEELVKMFLGITSIADFLAYQYAQDMVYSEIFDFDLNSFCTAGPGTQRGIERTFDYNGKLNHSEVVIWVHENYERLVEEYSSKYDIDLKPEFLPNFKPQVPDFSNCFCETDKYMRGSNIDSGVEGKRIKNVFHENKGRINYVFPVKWKVGELNKL